MEVNRNMARKEISLRELIEVLLRQKLLIAVIAAVILLAGFVVTFFVMDNSFEAKATLQVTPTDVEKESLENIEAIVEFYNKFPSMTVEAYAQQIASPQVAMKTIEKLDLRDGEGNPMTAEALMRMVEVSKTDNTNLISVKVTSGDAEKAATIANTISEAFIDFITENNRKQSQQVALLLEEQITAEEQKLDSKAQNLANYLASSRSIEELQEEVGVYVSQLTSIKSRITELETSIVSDQNALKAYKNIQVMTTGANATLDLPLNGGEGEPGISLEVPATQGSIPSMVYELAMAKIQTRLIENVETLASLTGKVDELQKKLSESQSVLAQEEYKYRGIQRELDLAQQTFNAYQQRHKEVIVAAAAEMGATNIIVSSSAVIPVEPVSPRKMMNLAISLMLGLMMGVFISFGREYWKRSAVAA